MAGAVLVAAVTADLLFSGRLVFIFHISCVYYILYYTIIDRILLICLLMIITCALEAI